MSSLRILLWGGGRTSGELLKLLDQPDCSDSLAACVTSKTPTSSLASVAWDVLVDFSTPEGCMAALAFAKQELKPLVTGTTGLSQDQLERLQDKARDIPILRADNFSVAAILMRQLVGWAAGALQDLHPQIAISELHHAGKKDRPSGTSKSLEAAVHESTAQSAAEAMEVQHSALRLGKRVGEHRVEFDLGSESLSLEHRAFDRQVYAQGALRAAKWLVDMPAGRLYTVDDTIELR